MAAFGFFAIGPAIAIASDPAPMLYATECASCHGDRGQGSNIAPPLIGRPAVDIHFMLDTGRMPASVPNVNEIPRAPQFTAQADNGACSLHSCFFSSTAAVGSAGDQAGESAPRARSLCGKLRAVPRCGGERRIGWGERCRAVARAGIGFSSGRGDSRRSRSDAALRSRRAERRGYR